MLDFHSIPKTELHVHLEGAIPLDALFELIEKYGGTPGILRPDHLFHRFQFSSFPEFIEAFAWKNTFLREPEDFRFIATALAESLKQQNIIHAEVLFSPSSFLGTRKLSVQRIVEAIREGFNLIPGVTIRLIADLVRDYGPDSELAILPALQEVQSLGVVGIGLGGSEQLFPPEPFSGVFRLARHMGFRTTVHAGEAAGPESIWAAIRHLRPDRIGHGIRAIEDDRLVDYLARNGIPLEVCPLSNVRTGVVESMEKHPVTRLYARGVITTINTDDPGMFHNTLVMEYESLRETGVCDSDILQMITMAESLRW